MNKGLQLGEGGKSSDSTSFSLIDRAAKILYKGTKLLRHYGTKIFRLTTHNSQFTKSVAFTLAETLIVMGVIGIVSALTLPNLNSSTGDKEKVAKVQKLYQNMSDAIGRAEAVYGPIDEWTINDSTIAAKSKRVGERITEFLKVSKDCGIAANQGCFSSASGVDASTDLYKVITADGSSVAFNGHLKYENEVVFVNGLAIVNYMDIDGPNKGRSQYGVDLFDPAFVYSFDKKALVLPAKDIDLAVTQSPAKGGTTWIINIGNMDYLKVNNSGQCKNNTSIVLDGVTNTTCK